MNILLLIIKQLMMKNMKNITFFRDIFNFTVDFSERYDKKFDFNFIIQDNETFIKNMKLICDNALEQLFDIIINENDKEDCSIIGVQENDINNSFVNNELYEKNAEKEDVNIIDEDKDNLGKRKIKFLLLIPLILKFDYYFIILIIKENFLLKFFK